MNTSMYSAALLLLVAVIGVDVVSASPLPPTTFLTIKKGIGRDGGDNSTSGNNSTENSDEDRIGSGFSVPDFGKPMESFLGLMSGGNPFADGLGGSRDSLGSDLPGMEGLQGLPTSLPDIRDLFSGLNGSSAE